MSPWLKNWQDFLDSLSTKGGNVLTLFWSCIFSGILWAWVVHERITDMITPTFGILTGFTGAFLQAQSGNSSRQQMADRIETASASQKVEAAKTSGPESAIKVI